MSAVRRRSLSSGRAKRGPGGRGARAAAPAFLALLLAACAGRYQTAWSPGQIRSSVQQGYYRVGAPYEVNGVWYYPAVDYHYDHTGVASWYGSSYDGRLTANGEIFRMNGLSAANPTLPLPSIVRVTNLENGRSLDLRVNDRGPFVGGRILDVSRYAAQLLGFENEGIAPVRVTIRRRQSIEVAELARRGIMAGGTAFAQAAPPVVPAPYVTPAPYARLASADPANTAPDNATSDNATGPPPLPRQVPQPRAEFAAAEPPLVGARTMVAEPRPIRPNVSLVSYRSPSRRIIRPAADRPAGRIFVQAGAFSVPRNAWHVRSRIAGLANVQVSTIKAGGVRVYRVRLGPFANVEEANRVLSRIISRGYPGARMVFD
jgi:rare lipoprotein A